MIVKPITSQIFACETFFSRSVCTIQSDVINFQHVLTSFAVFQSFTNLFRELNDRETVNHNKWTLKRLKLGMISSFHPHSLCKKVERVTAKTGRTSCTNWTISFRVSGFRTRTHLLDWHFIFLNILQLQTFFCVPYAPFKVRTSIFNTFWHRLLFLMYWLIYFQS